MLRKPDNWNEISKADKIKYLEIEIDQKSWKLKKLSSSCKNAMCDADRSNLKLAMNRIVDELIECSDELSSILANMKIMTMDEIKDSMEFGDLYTTEEFREMVTEGSIIDDDGCGYFHDGRRETKIDVFSFDWFSNKECEYPYVCWYNK